MNQEELLKHIKLGENSDIEFKRKGGLLNHFGEVSNTNGWINLRVKKK